MKPRLDSHRLTYEDFAIWVRVMGRWSSRGHLLALAPRAHDSDRRDADLMLQLTKMRNSLRSLKRTTDQMIEGLSETEKRVLRELFGHNI